MPIALIVGPGVALIGIVSVFFVLRRKSVEKRSMYSARRSQIEHKVRAARQRTLTPHGRSERPVEAPAAAVPASPFAPTEAQPTINYEPAAYQPPPSAPAPPMTQPPSSEPSPWDVGPAAPPTPPPFMPPPPEPETYRTEPFAPAAQPAYEPPPSEPAWTPGPAPSEPATPIEPARPATPAGATAGWSIVNDARADTVESAPGKKGKKGTTTSSWTLASGDAPGSESEDIVKKPSPAIAIAQYAILVVGLVMVLIGVLVMVANSHVT